MAGAGAVDKAKWMEFQADFHTLALQRDRTRREVEALEAQLAEAEAMLDEVRPDPPVPAHPPSLWPTTPAHACGKRPLAEEEEQPRP